MTVVLTGLREIVDRYDAFVLDLWGVVHGGVEPFPGVLDALTRLRDAGKPVALLSNVPRRADFARTRLDEMGVTRDLYVTLMTSGEAAYRALRHDEAVQRRLGRRFFFIGPPETERIPHELALEEVDTPDEAEFLFCVGLFDEQDPEDMYDPLLAVARRRGLPLVCVNPDRVVDRQGFGTVRCAGWVAERFERQGGEVLWFGKPNPSIFHQALAALDVPDKARVVMLGDSLTTDIPGAHGAGFASVLVTRGIHAKALGVEAGATPTAERLAQLYADHQRHPDAAIASLVW